MSEFVLSLFFTLTASGLVVFASVLIWTDRAKPVQEDWRDRPPMLFRLARPLVNLFVTRVERSMRVGQRDVLQTRLNAAGMSYAITPSEFITTRRVALAGGVLVLAYVNHFLDLTRTQLVFAALIMPLAYFYPDIWLRDVTKRRQNLISKQFPFFLELLVLSMRAGLNFSSAISHSVERMAGGPVREEFGRVLRETRTGMTRSTSLAGMAKRVDMPPVTNFVAVVNQAEEVGGELSHVLAVQATQRRKERFLRAEKLANQAPVKMLFPLIAFLFPITMIIVMFPIVIKARDSGVMSFFGG